MQYNTPNPRTRKAPPRKNYAPRKRKSRVLSTLPILLLFVAALALFYLLSPKEAGRHVGSSQYDGLMITEVMSANSSAVPDENGEFPDWLEIYNGTGADLDMEGVIITNRTDRVTFPFPSFTLQAGEYVIVFASDSYQLDPSEPFHGKFKISSAGDHLYLYDPDMYLIDELTVPTMTADNSYSLISVDEDGTRHYESSTFYSPGYANGEDGFVSYRAANVTEAGSLVINEVCPDPKIGIPDDDGEIVDWIEIKNNTAQPISLTGYYLSDKENKPMKWRFPDGAVVPANGYYLVYCSGKDKLQSNGVPHTNFSVSAERETLVLSDRYGRLVDRVSIENVPEDYSMGRSDSGEWRQFQLTTPAQPNNEAGQARADEIYRACNPTGVYISEVLASNDNVPAGILMQYTDYVELYNSSSVTVDLSGYGLSDSLKRPRRWQFPQGATIAPGEYKIVFLTGDTSQSTVTDYFTNFSLSRAGGETISFCDPTGRVLDRIPLPTIPTDHSYGRTIGYSGYYFYDVPTPAAANGTGYYGYVSDPTVSEPGGEYTGTKYITISVPENSVVFYTLDGSIPHSESYRYTEGEVLTMDRVTVLRIRAFDTTGRLQPSNIVTQTYLPNLFHAFPIVSLVSDPDILWNEQTGMLVSGPDIDKSNGIPFRNAIYRTVKEDLGPQEGHIEIFDEDGAQIICQGVDFSLQGQYSLDLPQKSFKLRAKARYGNKYFEAKLFERLDFTEYKSIALRMGGNDGAWTRMVDVFQSQLIRLFNEQAEVPTTVLYQEWQPVVVYLNGVYWGHYNMRERVDRFFVAQHEGLSMEEADNMDILQASASRRQIDWGSNAEYLAMIEHVEASSPGTSEEDLQYILDRVDVDNYFDYMAFEMFFGNSDPGNIRYYKLDREGSKWRWIFYDADYGFFRAGFNSPYSYLKPEGAGDMRINNTLIRKLLENEEMRHKFLMRLGEIYQFCTTDYMLNTFNEIAAILEPEMALHFARWAEETDKAATFDNPTTPEGALRYWNTRLNRTRNVLKKRPTYFYEMVQEQFELTDDQMVIYFGQKPAMPDDAIIDNPNQKWS